MDVLTDVCWAFSYLSDSGEDRVEEILKCPVVPRLISLLTFHNIAVSIPCLRTVGNIATGNEA